jgi:hypothetical protein
LLLGFCREQKVSVNEVVNLAVSDFLGCCDVEVLRLKARLVVLLREEKELRRTCTAMLRSGSYLPGYVERVLKEPGRPLEHLRTAQTPLKALSPIEEKAFRKIAARREKIAGEIANIQLELLKDVRPFRLKPDSWSRRRDKKEPFSQREEGESENG